MSAPLRIALRFNPIAGAGRARGMVDRVAAHLTTRGHVPHPVPTQPGTAAGEERAALSDCDVVVVIGGDGAVRHVASLIAGTEVALYHYAAGTENLFSRSFGMRATTTALDRALDGARELGGSTRIDLGRIGNDVFALMASAGFDANVVHGLAARRTGAISHLSYLPVIANEFPGWSPPEVAVGVDGGEPHSLGTGIVVVANLPAYGLRLDPVRQANPCDGLLDVTFLPCKGGPGALWWMVRCWLSGQELAGAIRFRGARIEVRTSPPSRWQLDGDPAALAVGQGDLVLSAWPQALRVLGRLRPSRSWARPSIGGRGSIPPEAAPRSGR